MQEDLFITSAGAATSVLYELDFETQTRTSSDHNAQQLHDTQHIMKMKSS